MGRGRCCFAVTGENCHSTPRDVRPSDACSLTHSLLLVFRIRVSRKKRLKLGEAFLDCSEEYATEYCEKKVSKYTAAIESMTAEEGTILARQKELKKLLYGRFGKAINLEE